MKNEADDFSKLKGNGKIFGRSSVGWETTTHGRGFAALTCFPATPQHHGPFASQVPLIVSYFNNPAEFY